MNEEKKGFRYSPKELKAIKREIESSFPDGRFTPRDILQIARNRKSILHDYFQWDDTRAAELYRIDQARKLIATVTVTIENTEVREYHSIRVAQGLPREFMSIHEIMKAPDIYNQVLERAMQDALAWKRRYQTLKELEPVVASISKLERKYHAKTKESAARV